MAHIRRRGAFSVSLINIVFAIICICFVIPLVYIISISFSDERALAEYGFTLILRDFSLLAYRYTFANSSIIWNGYLISVVVTGIGSTVGLLLTAALGYVVARRDFVLNKVITTFVLVPLLFNGGLVGFYMVVTRVLSIQNTILALILPYLVLPWHVFLMRGFMKDIPMSILESARIDGAGEVLTFTRLVLPLSKAALATIGVFMAFIYWNDWWLAMLFVENRRLLPIQYLLYTIMNDIAFVTQNTGTSVIIDRSQFPNESARMAIAVIAAVPMMLIFPFFQKHFVKGLVVGSIKG